MDCLATPLRRRCLFAALYLSEGAPIGFLWLALPTQLRAAGVPIENITQLTAILVIPWTLKFAWAPLVDFLRWPRWTLKHWVISAQILMGATLLPLLWLDLREHFHLMIVLLPLHAFAAATQDVAIDALCISVTDASERGQLNGWMQTGMLLGRAAMGGGALMLAEVIGPAAVVVILVTITMFSGVLLLMSRLPAAAAVGSAGADPSDEQTRDAVTESGPASLKHVMRSVVRKLVGAFAARVTWFALAFALIAPACFKALEVVIGPFLIDRGYTKFQVGQFTAVVMIGAMVLGSVTGGVMADRFARRQFVRFALLLVTGAIVLLAVADLAFSGSGGLHLLVLLGCTAFGIGLFTVAVYAMFMDLTRPAVAATQFSAFMGATNGCEAWSTFTMGEVTARIGYPEGMLLLCGASLLALPLLRGMDPHQQDEAEVAAPSDDVNSPSPAAR